MKIKIGNLSISKFIKGILGTRLIDPIEVFFDSHTNTIYPIISKSGCSTIKQDIIKKYNPSFESEFPEIHKIDPKKVTQGKVLRLYFNNFKSYRKFSNGKKAVLVIRNPYDRIYSCFLDVKKDKNIMYETPSGLHHFFGINKDYTFKKFINIIIKIPDYLSDRHFRSQYFYISHNLKDVLNEIEIILLENYNQSKHENTAKLNSNDKIITLETLNFLKENKSFKKRFKKDLEIYFNLKNNNTSILK